MNREAIAQLREKILRSTGIELEKYRNQMLIENSVELLLFPKYVLKIILGTLFAFFALWVLLLGWVLFQERFLSAFLLFGLGIILVLANGILFGILRVLDSLAHDLKEILQLTIVTVQQVFKDFKSRNYS